MADRLEPSEEMDAPTVTQGADTPIADGEGYGDPTRTAGAASTEAQVLPRGSLVGRYVLLEPVGEGGMGVVYRAFDPELDRAVAVKLIRSAGAGDEARARLVREAQAMARLSHPNVVAVHDVGTFDDQVFVAMELLSGQTLRAWLGTPRTWREIARAFADAGRGLAAAHRAGLVHRDFKPANAFVEDGGRVRLLDFGLARAADAVSPLAASAPRLSSLDDDLSLPTPVTGIHASVTRVGRVAGTPRYMAPEQQVGEASAQSDQYAFCVALCEAIYQRRARPDLPERDLRGPGPRRLRALVSRGLRVEASARFPSMDVIVAALDSMVTSRRPAAIATALGVVAAGALAVVARGTPAADPGARCRSAGAAIATVWAPASADALRGAFLATGRPYAADAADRVVTQLDQYAGAWSAARRAACEATWVRGEQSQELLDRRMACLDRRLAAIRAYAEVLTRGTTADVVDRAVTGLPSPSELDACGDREALESGGAWPASASRRAEIAALEARLEEVWSLRFAARYDDATRIAREVLTEARRMPRPPLAAEALYALGAVQQAAGDGVAARATLGEAITAAGEARTPHLLARAAALQVYVVGDQLGRADESIGMAELARAQARLVGDPPNVVAALHNNLGNVLYWKGHYPEARAEYAAALAIESETLGPDHVDVAWSWTNLGGVLAAEGHPAPALVHYERAMAIAEAALGPQHPDLAPFLNNLATVLIDLGDLAAAERHVVRAIAILEPAVGRRHRRIAELLVTVGAIADARGRHAEALRACDEALAIDTPAVDAGHIAIGYELLCRGRALVGLRRAREAVPVLERALAIMVAQTDDVAERAAVQTPLAEALWETGARERAIALATEARAAYRAAPGHARGRAAVEALLARVGRR